MQIPPSQSTPAFVRAPSSGAASGHPLDPDSHGFVARERELDQLLEALSEAAHGRGRLYLVTGEPGIGKSRLADEFGRRSKERGALVLSGRCWEAGGAPVYWPWVQAMRGYVRETDGEALRGQLGPDAAFVARMLPEIAQLFPDLPTPPQLDAESARFRLFDAIATFLFNIARSAPLVLVIEDLHAADASSLLLLQFIARELSTSNVLIVATYRDTDVGPGHPLASALSDLTREPTATRLRLTGFAEGDVARFIEGTTGLRPAPALVRAISEATEGNPLFAGEVVRLMATEGRLEDPRAAAATWRVTIPQGVRDVIGQRLAHLSPECKEVLSVASVLGRDFDLPALASATGRSREQLLELLDEGVQARVITSIPGAVASWRFAHSLIRDTLYEGIAPSRRIHLHLRVGEVLEQLHSRNPDLHLAELAHHFFEAAPLGDVDRAVGYARMAGERAMRLLAYEEAARLYRMALAALDLEHAADDGPRCDLLLALGDALARAGEAGAARQTFLEAAELAKSGGMPEQLARAALGYGGRFVWEAGRGDPHLVPLLHAALDALDEADAELRVKMLARLAAGPLRDEVDHGRRESLSRQAVEMARRLDDPATLSYALEGRYSAIWWPDNLEERLALAADLVRAAEEAGDKERQLQAHHFRCLAVLEAGDMEGVYRELDAQARVAEELRQPAQQGYVRSTQTTLATMQGRFQEAEELIREAFQLGERAHGPMAEVYEAIHLYTLRRLQGRLEEVLPMLERVALAFPTYPVLRCVLAQAYGELQRELQARRELARFAEDGFAGLPLNEEWLFGMSLLAEVAAYVGDQSAAETLYEHLLPYAARNAVSAPDACTGSVSRNLAVLAAAASRSEEAEVHFERALAINERIAARPWLALTQYEYGRMLIARGNEGDREKAAQLLASAAETARSVGMSRLDAESGVLLQQLGVTGERGERTERTFMFTDIVNSTPLVEALGDDAWEALIRWHDRTLRSIFDRFGGEEVDHAGDGFFVAFADPRQALLCAVAVQQALARHRESHGFAPRVRVGVHATRATKVDGNYRGKGVHEAARIAAVAGAEEVMASRQTAERVQDVPKSRPRSAALKGLSDVAELVTIDWRSVRVRS